MPVRRLRLSESFLHGVSYKIGEVHEGTAVMDWMEQEQEARHYDYIGSHDLFLEAQQRRVSNQYYRYAGPHELHD